MNVNSSIDLDRIDAVTVSQVPADERDELVDQMGGDAESYKFALSIDRERQSHTHTEYHASKHEALLAAYEHAEILISRGQADADAFGEVEIPRGDA